MDKASVPAIAAVMEFIGCVNRRDIDGLRARMTDGHTLHVFDEEPVSGREALVEAWRGYFASFPEYLIHPHEYVYANNGVAVLGHTTGSHLGLPDDVEREQTVIWFARVESGRLRLWRLLEDTAHHRHEFRVGATA
jgi:ketosteroid isomerase-like protein